MATENTILINDFSKGMNTDTSDAYLDKSAYRLANNLRFITNTGENSGELHMIEGVVSVSDKIQADAINAVTQLRDLGIIVCEKGGTWEVWVIEKDSNDPVCVARVTADKNPKNRVIGKKVSVVARYEDEDNQKLYIADGRGSIMVVPLTDEDGEILNLTDEEDTDIDKITSYPSALLNVPKFSGLASGRLKAALYQYSYQMYNKHGAASEISTATKLISLRKGNLAVQDSNKIEGYEKDTYTDKGINITINLDDSLLKFDSIRIYRISYVEAGQLPTVECIYDDKLTPEQLSNKRFDYTDVGEAALSVHTLEEYNSMTGIHIIPEVIESKDDYMFAANIKGDSFTDENPEVLEWDAAEHITWKFVTADIVGDVNDDPGKITIKNTETFSKTVTVKEVGGSLTWSMDLSNFIGDLNDKNNTYANAYVTYSLKSLRRGETYRYGIVLYDEYGHAYAVKHIADITAPTAQESPFFTYDGDKLIVHPMGIKFEVDLSGLPADANITRYEIVRCGRSESDMKTITQCVLSRPIARMFDAASADQDGIRRQHTSYPLTPTGWITTQDYFTFPQGVDYPFESPLVAGSGGNDPRVENITYAATNMDIIDGNLWKVYGNYNIFQAISPEYSYQSDSLKDLLKQDEIKIEPIAYISPTLKGIPVETLYDLSVYLRLFASASLNRIYKNIGNEYAKVHIGQRDASLVPSHNEGQSTNYVHMNYWYDTLSSYYYKITDGPQMSIWGENFERDYQDSQAGRYSYIKLYTNNEMSRIDPIDITSVGFPEILSWDSFATPEEEYKLSYVDKVTAIGGKNFVNWVCNGLYNVDSTVWIYIADEDGSAGSDNKSYYHNNDLKRSSCPLGTMMGPGGKCFLISLKEDTLGGIPANAPDMGTFLCNITHNVEGARYGGDGQHAKESSIYRSYGDYFKSGEPTFVFDGDCFIMPFEYISQHKWYHPYMMNGRKAMIVYSIPMETNINLAYTYGYEFSKNIDGAEGDITNIQNDAGNVNNIFIQDKPLYLYNAAYSSTPRAVTLNAQSTNEDDYGTNLDYRVYHSLPKENNEPVDSWLKFMSGDFLDVDNRYGPITGLRRFHNQLIFWQRVATGILLVNERAQITDDNNLPLILGTGSVLGRFDYLNTSNGMKDNQYCDAQSDATLYWWDYDRKEIVGYSGGLETLILSKVRFIQNILNKYTTDKLLDRPNIFFDKQFNEAVFTLGNHDYPEYGSYAYNEHLGQFTSLYSIMPAGAITFADKTLLVKNDGGIRKWNTLGKNPDGSDGAFDLDGREITPYLKYIVNANTLYTKVFDNGEFGGRVYGGSTEDKRTYEDINPLKHITMTFSTPLKQHGVLTGDKIDNREYNFRYAIPRHNDSPWGDRLRGKTMQVEMESVSNSYDFSLLFLSTKYRISWA